jgi:cysteinyl-tRNA synthetase
MNLHHIGEQIDIHGGGNDLIFPHHENEIAQSESFTGKTFATYWVHNGMLQFSGEKMSKSVGNLITIEDFLADHPANSLRMMVLNSGYRSPLTFNEEVIGQAEKAIERLRSALKPALPGASAAIDLSEQNEKTRKLFEEAMDDDFNSAGALGALFDLVRAVNQARADGADQASLIPAQSLLMELSSVMGLKLEEEEAGGHPADKYIDYLIELRGELRAQKMWALSDQIRDRLKEMGVAVEDSRDGASWRWQD